MKRSLFLYVRYQALLLTFVLCLPSSAPALRPEFAGGLEEPQSPVHAELARSLTGPKGVPLELKLGLLLGDEPSVRDLYIAWDRMMGELAGRLGYLGVKRAILQRAQAVLEGLTHSYPDYRPWSTTLPFAGLEEERGIKRVLIVGFSAESLHRLKEAVQKWNPGVEILEIKLPDALLQLVLPALQPGDVALLTDMEQAKTSFDREKVLRFFYQSFRGLGLPIIYPRKPYRMEEILESLQEIDAFLRSPSAGGSTPLTTGLEERRPTNKEDTFGAGRETTLARGARSAPERGIGRLLTPQVLEQATQVKGQVAIFVERDLWAVLSDQQLEEHLSQIAESWRHLNRDGQTLPMVHLESFTTGDPLGEYSVSLYRKYETPVLKIVRATQGPSDGWTLSLTNLGNRRLPVETLPILIVEGLALPNQPIEKDAGDYLDLKGGLEEIFRQLSAAIFA